MTDLAEQDGLPTLDKVLHNGLLLESEHRPITDGHYTFAHPKIRAVVYAETSNARRSIFHRRALEALNAAAVPAAELAYHALAAGDEAMGGVAVSSAIAYYEQARHLMAERSHGLDLKSTLPAPEIEHLYTHLGRAYELNTQWEKARAVYTSLLAYAQDAQQQVMENSAQSHLAMLTAQ